MITNPQQCRHVKADGTQCKARKVQGTDFCFFHDPASAAKRTQARAAGGRKGKAAVLPADTPIRTIRTAGDVIDLLSETVNQVRVGALDPKVCNCVGYLAGIILKATEQGELEERLAALEGIVNRQERPTSFMSTDPERLLSERATA